MKKIAKYFFSNTENIRFSLFIYFIVAIFLSIVSVVFPLCEGKLIDAITQKKIVAFFSIVSIYVVLSLISLLMNLYNNKLLIKITNTSLNQMIMNHIDHFLHIPYDQLCKKDSSVVSQELIQDCGAITSFVLKNTLSILLNAILLVFTIFVIANQSLIMLFIILVSALLYLILYISLKDKIYQVSEQMNDSSAQYYSYFYKIINFIKDIRLNSFINYSKDIETSFFNKQLDISLKYQKVMNIQEMLSGLINCAVQTFIFIYGMKLVLAGKMSVGTIIVIGKYSSTILGYSKGILTYVSDYQNTKASFNRISKWTKISKIQTGQLTLEGINKIRCTDLSFTYGGTFTLSTQNLIFEKGNIYLIKGKNGSGKTTLLDCIFGIFGKNFEGEISFNEIDIKDIDLEQTIKDHFAISQQVPFLLETSIKENMSCCSNDFYQDQELIRLVNGFGLRRYIEDLPNKENTILNVFSDEISGGEKQKISLIRTFMSHKSVLVFDEPYTYLDEDAKKFFNSEILKNKDNSIIMIVSHDDLNVENMTITL